MTQADVAIAAVETPVRTEPGMAAPLQGAGDRQTLDFDLHGLARIRLIDACVNDVHAVRGQLGPLSGPPAGEPDIVIRFVDRLSLGRVRYLGLDEAAFTDEAFIVLRSRHKARARVAIPFERIGRRPEIVCESGLPAVPLLVPILNLTLIGKGILPLHASAFEHEGTGIVATGWSKGGKTEALLAFTARGARYVGDEWTYVSPNGRGVFGIPEPVRVWSWQLRQLPEVQARLRRGQLTRLRSLEVAGRLVRGAGGRLGRVHALLRHQLYLDLDPDLLFGPAELPPTCSFDRLVLVASHDRPDMRATPIDPDEVARRMAFSLAHERLQLTTWYLRFRFAFPELSSPLVDAAEEIERDLLHSAFRDKPAFLVHHPYPMRLADLFDVMVPLCV